MDTTELRQLYYRWDALEKKLPDGVDIIDFDLIQEDRSSTISATRDEIDKGLQQYYTSLQPKNAQERFIKAKINASIHFLHALLKEEEPFDDYIRNTMYVNPQILPEPYIVALRREAEKRLKKIGYSLAAKDFAAFKKDNQLSRSEIQSTFLAFRDTVLPRFLAWLKIDVPLSYRVEFVNVDAYWQNWVCTDDSGNIVLKYNLDKRHDWYRGLTEYLVLHEICGHLVHLMSWKKQIKEGSMDPFIGLVSAFSPEQFLCEGIAESLTCFFPENRLSELGELAMYLDWLHFSVWNNVHLRLNDGENKQKLKEYVYMYLPWSQDSVVESELASRAENPFFRTYQYIYGISLYWHRHFAQQALPAQKRDYARFIYKNAVVYDDIRKYWKGVV